MKVKPLNQRYYINIPHRLTSGTLTSDAPTRAVNRQMEAALVGTVFEPLIEDNGTHAYTRRTKKTKK